MTEPTSPFRAYARFTAVDGELIAAALKALAEPVRLQIINLLTKNGPMTIGALTAFINKTQPTISHHVKALCKAGFITAVPGGQYAIDMDAVRRVADLIHPDGPHPAARQRSMADDNATHSRTSVPHSADVTA